MFKMLKNLNKKIVSSTIASVLGVAVIIFALVMLSKNNFSFKKAFKEVKETLNECTGELISKCEDLTKKDDCEKHYKIDADKGTITVGPKEFLKVDNLILKNLNINPKTFVLRSLSLIHI